MYEIIRDRNHPLYTYAGLTALQSLVNSGTTEYEQRALNTYDRILTDTTDPLYSPDMKKKYWDNIMRIVETSV